MTRFTISRNRTTGDYEVVAWRDKIPLVVQVNIPTRVKAEAARQYWRGLIKGDDEMLDALVFDRDDPEEDHRSNEDVREI